MANLLHFMLFFLLMQYSRVGRGEERINTVVVLFNVHGKLLLFNVHGKHLWSCQDSQLT